MKAKMRFEYRVAPLALKSWPEAVVVWVTLVRKADSNSIGPLMFTQEEFKVWRESMTWNSMHVLVEKGEVTDGV